MAVPERFIWAADLMEIQTGDRILEVGCGGGVAVDVICDRLVTGTITAIDRSSKMTALASVRNKRNIDSGKAQIQTDELTGFTSSQPFGKIFLYNINAFWMDPADELSAVKRLLAPHGKFFIFHRPPPQGDTREYANAFEKNLIKYGFSIIDIKFNDDPDVNSVCVISLPGQGPSR